MKKIVLSYFLFALLSSVVILPGIIMGKNVGDMQVQKRAFSQAQSFVYPNPVKDFLYVELQELDPSLVAQSELRLEIRNILGNVMPVEIERIDGAKLRINASEYPNGYYVLAIYCDSCPGENQFRGSFKFLKQ